MEKQEIVITVEGGVIQSVDNIPDNIKVKVIDFDCEGTDEGITELIEGEPAVISYWEVK